MKIKHNKALIISIALMFFMKCEYNTILSSEVEALPVFKLGGRAIWQLQHEGEGEDRHPVARVMLDMRAYYDGIVEGVWFHGKLMDYDTYELISEDSVYIGHFVERADSIFSIYKQDGYENRPVLPRWAMWVTSEN
jgi:hypothetical protein